MNNGKFLHKLKKKKTPTQKKIFFSFKGDGPTYVSNFFLGSF